MKIKIKKLMKEHLSVEQLDAMKASKSELKLLKSKLVEILDGLDFERINKTMIALDWGWSMPNGKSVKIPNIDELKVAVIRLVIRTFYYYKTTTELPVSIGMGGFDVEFTPSEKYFNISVEFIVDYWVTYDD